MTSRVTLFSAPMTVTDSHLSARMQQLLIVGTKQFAIDESEEVQRHRRQQLEDFIAKCCGDGLAVEKLPQARGRAKRKQAQPRHLTVDINELAINLKKDGLLGNLKKIPIKQITEVKPGVAGSNEINEAHENKCWVTVVTTSRPYELKAQSLKVRDQLVSFLRLLQEVSSEDGDSDFAGMEPGVDALRESISEVRQSMSSFADSEQDIHSSARSSFGMRDSFGRPSCSGRDSLSSVWDSKPAFRRSEANVDDCDMDFDLEP